MDHQDFFSVGTGSFDQNITGPTKEVIIITKLIKSYVSPPAGLNTLILHDVVNYDFP